MIRLVLIEDSQRQLRTLRRNIQQLEQKLNNAILGQKGRLANRALSKLTREPGPPIYPLRWASEKQRRAFFASKGFGRGIPAKRTGTLLDNWDVLYTWSSEGGVISLSNPVDYMRYVQGGQAQPFHLDTGYVQVADVVDDFYAETEDIVIETFFALDPLEGV